MTFKNQNIWIVGASSGIGKQLAIDLSQKGANIILSSRSEDKLLEAESELEKNNSLVNPFDISDLQQIENAISEVKNNYDNIDRIIVLSSIYEPSPIEDIDLEFMSKLIDVNLKGIIYFTSKILPILKKQDTSQYAVCASISGYTGLPNGQPYSCSKAAVINFMESLKCEAPKNIDVRLINPGFVETPMTDKNDFEMPMRISVQKASSALINGMESKSFEINFPKIFTNILRFISILPQPIKLFISKKAV